MKRADPGAVVRAMELYFHNVAFFDFYADWSAKTGMTANDIETLKDPWLSVAKSFPGFVRAVAGGEDEFVDLVMSKYGDEAADDLYSRAAFAGVDLDGTTEEIDAAVLKIVDRPSTKPDGHGLMREILDRPSTREMHDRTSPHEIHDGTSPHEIHDGTSPHEIVDRPSTVESLIDGDLKPTGPADRDRDVLPCPFGCRSDKDEQPSVEIHKAGGWGDVNSWRVSCSSGCSGPTSFQSRANAVAKWNGVAR